MNTWPIFHEPWWLDAVVGSGAWGECVVQRGEEQFARLPYVQKKKYGFTVITQPPLSQYLGPWFKGISGQKSAKRLAREKDLTGELIKQLPKHDFFLQNFSPEITNWLPWYWNGYKQTTRYTYRLPDFSNLDRTWDKFETKIRTDIRKSQKNEVSLELDARLEDFLPLRKKTFQRQGLNATVSDRILRRLDHACQERACRKIIIAKGNDGQSHAGAYLVWNNHTVWYLMGGGDPGLRRSGATSAVLWEAIKFCSEQNKIFDFEGSMHEPIERFFRAFGAQQVPFFQITKARTRWLSLVLSITGKSH